MSTIKKVILVWFDKDLLSDSLLPYKVLMNKYIHKTDKHIQIKEYAYYLTQLYNNNWVFFDNIFKSITDWITSNNNIENSAKHRTSWIIDSYPLMHKRIDKLLNNVWWCLIISKNKDNEYSYLLDLLEVEKVYLSSEFQVAHYLKSLNSRFIKN